MLRLKLGKFALVWRPENQPRKGRRLAFTFLLLGTLVYAGVPHTFKDGDTLTASRLNENFQALSAKIDAMEGKSWRLIYETDVTSATTSVTATGLDGNTDAQYQIKLRIAGGATGGIYVRPNNDTNTANYGTQDIYGAGTGAAAMSRSTTAQGLFCGGIAAGSHTTCVLEMAAKSGAPRFSTALLNENTTGTTIDYSRAVAAVWTNTGSNISSLSFFSTVAGGIGAGSHIEIWARR